MTVLDHTIVNAVDTDGSATFLTEMLGLPPPQRLGPFVVVRVGETLTLDFVAVDGPVPNGHLLEAITRSCGTGGSTTEHPHPLVNANKRKG